MTMKLFTILFIALLTVACANSDQANTKETTASEPTNKGIAWKKWEQSSFDLAKKLDKMIFIDVGTEWCTACNWMEEGTYTNEEVQNLLSENFITIKVDAEAQPNVGNRYLDWGWPALIFMTPDGKQIHAIQGNKRPHNFIPILNDLIDKFNDGYEFEDQYEPDVKISKVNSDILYLNSIAENAINQYYDNTNFGWGFGLKMSLYNNVEMAFQKFYETKDSAWFYQSINTLNRVKTITDPLWGGVYFGSYNKDWSEPLPEKRTEYQAGTIRNFVEAYQLTGNIKWLKEAELIASYLERFMRSNQGLYYNGQEEYLKPNPNNLEPLEYYALSEEKRLEEGIPPIDKTVYSDMNAKIARAYGTLYQSTGNDFYKDAATKIGKQLINSKNIEKGRVQQAIDNLNNRGVRMRELDNQDKTYLRTQVHTGLALLDLYNLTGEHVYLEKCDDIIQHSLAALWNENEHAFAGSDENVVILNGQSSRQYPYRDNGFAAQLMLRYAELTGEASYTKKAEQLLVYLGQSERIKEHGRLVAAYITALSEHIDPKPIVVVKGGYSTYKALFDILGTNASKVTVLNDTEDKYPIIDYEGIYICAGGRCSAAIPLANVQAELLQYL